MSTKKKLGDMLPDEPAKPVIRRGQGIRFSTDSTDGEEIEKSRNVEIENSRDVEMEKTIKSGRKTQGIERVKPGYEVRKDLLLAVKRLALDEDRFNYEIVEDALEAYLRSKGRL